MNKHIYNIWTFLRYLFSCNSQWVVQFSGQVGTLAFNVAGVVGGGPGIQGALGHTIVNWRCCISVLLQRSKGEQGEERKHNHLQKKLSYRWETLTLKPTRTFSTGFLNQTTRQHQAILKYTTRRNQYVNEAGQWCSWRLGQPPHDWMKQSS